VVLLAPACLLFRCSSSTRLVRRIACRSTTGTASTPKTWVGLDNYRELFADPVFATALANNLRWLAATSVAPVAASRCVFLNQRLPGMRSCARSSSCRSC
jgi:multiple sugar transport system permease protein